MANVRVFFALWPDEATRTALDSARTRLFPLDGRPIDADNLHLTLAFLGSVSEHRIPALLALPNTLPTFSVSIDRVEYWRKSRVIAAVCSTAPLALHRNADQLWQRLDRLGFAREARPYRPHVTLVRDAGGLRTAARWTPVSWQASSVTLIESLSTPQGSRYRPLVTQDPDTDPRLPRQ